MNPELSQMLTWHSVFDKETVRSKKTDLISFVKIQIRSFVVGSGGQITQVLRLDFQILCSTIYGVMYLKVDCRPLMLSRTHKGFNIFTENEVC